jgi:hypothetical protein
MDIRDFSESVMIMPFMYLGSKHKGFNDFFSMDEDSCIWAKEQKDDYDYSYKYLTKNVSLLAFDKEVSVCSFYYLKNEAKEKLQIPRPNSEVQMSVKSLEGPVEEYKFYLTNIRLVYFTTKIGFLLLYIKHPYGERMQAIADKMFSLSRCMMIEHDGKFNNECKTKESFMKFQFLSDDKIVNFSLKNSVLAIMNAENDKKCQIIKLFHDASIKKAFVYHRLFFTNLSDDNKKRNLYFLRRGLSSNSMYSDEEEERNSRDITYYSYEKALWSISPQGAVSLSICEKDSSHYKFLTSAYQRNIMSNYFFLYLLQLHERQALVFYNAIAIRNRKDMRKLASMKKSLLNFFVCFSINSISDESSYQNFYECVYDSLNLNKLESDIKEIICQVEEYELSINDRRMNEMLAVIALFSIVSVTLDGLNFVDRINNINKNPLGQFHVVWLCIIFVSLVLATIKYFKKPKNDDEF